MAPNVPGTTIQAKSQGRVATDVPGATKRRQNLIIHQRTKGQDSSDDEEYFSSEAERKRMANGTATVTRRIHGSRGGRS